MYKRKKGLFSSFLSFFFFLHRVKCQTCRTISSQTTFEEGLHEGAFFFSFLHTEPPHPSRFPSSYLVPSMALTLSRPKAAYGESLLLLLGAPSPPPSSSPAEDPCGTPPTSHSVLLRYDEFMTYFAVFVWLSGMFTARQGLRVVYCSTKRREGGLNHQQLSSPPPS